MVLSDRSIREQIAARRIVIDPFDEECIQPASVDLRLDKHMLKFKSAEEYSVLDVRQDLSDATTHDQIPFPHPYVLEPGQFILANTLETIELPNDLVARLEGKSSLGRLGLLVHATAGYVDPGFKGQLTLEISNVARAKIALHYEMKISQLSFLKLSTPADRPYGTSGLGSKYQGQKGPTPSRGHLNFKSNLRASRPYKESGAELKDWIDSSEFRGNVRRFSEALGVNHKTVQGWIYGRSKPNVTNSSRLYDITGLTRYAYGLRVGRPPLFSSPESHLEPIVQGKET